MRDVRSHNAIGKYQLIASLGQGGMANVYLALVAGPAGVNKLIVVKLLASEILLGVEGGVELFWDEARLAARLVHSNIVHTYEVGEADGDYFLAMEYLDGQTLRVVQVRSAHDPLPLVEELRILSEVARGLHYAHDLEDFHGEPLNVVHRDVSPQNVFVTYDGQVKVIDFGIAKTRDAEHETRVGLIKGKLNYIAPEHIRGENLDRRADVFALGVMLWETVAGRRFAGGAQVPEIAKINARLKGEEPNIRSVKPDVQEQLASIIDRALHLDVNKRWSSAAAFADAVDAYIDSTGERPGSRSLAAWMQQRFAQERAAMHAVIDERVKLIMQSSSAIEVDKMPHLPVLEGTGSRTWPGERSGVQNRTSEHAGELVESVKPTRPGRTSQLAVIGVLAVLAVAAFAALFMPADAARPPAAPATEPLGVGVAHVPETVAVQAQQLGTAGVPSAPQVTIRVNGLPASAQLSIDGADVDLPFSGAFIKSEVLHRIEATAKGHKAAVRLVAFTQDQTVELVLEPLVEAGRRREISRPRAHAESHAVMLPAPASSGEARPAPSEEPAKSPASVTPGTAETVAPEPVEGLVNGGAGTAPKPAEKLVPSKDLPGNVFPPYPKSAHRRGHTGSVVVAFDVLPDGKVANATVVDGPEEFHETVLKTARTWRFQPATLGGKPVVQRRTKTITFNLEEDP